MAPSKKINKPTVLVIGPGYLGRALIPMLIASYRVLAFSRSPYPGKPKSVKFYRGDAASGNALKSCIRQADIVINLLGGGGNEEVMANPDWAIQTYIDASKQICLLAKKYRIRHLLLSSSIAVHRAEVNPYGFLKLAQEQILAKSAVPYTIMRFANIFGSNGQQMSKKGLLGQFISKAAAGLPLKIRGNGRQKVDYLHLKDAGAAIKLLLSLPPRNEVYNIGTARPLTVNKIARQVIKQVKSLTGKKSKLIRVSEPASASYPQVSSQGIRKLGWRPKTSFAKGLNEVIKNYVKKD